MSHSQEASSAFDESDLQASQTPGYKAGAPKTLEELNQLDADDEALQKYKAALLGGAGASGSAGGKPVVTLVALRLTSPQLQTPIRMDLSSPAKIAELKKQSNVTIKEGAEYAAELEFLVSGGICSGMKYIQVAKRAGVKVDKVETMIGSFGPSEQPVVKRFATEEAPSGMLARGTYSCRSRVIDDDNVIHHEFEWQFKIAKDW